MDLMVFDDDARQHVYWTARFQDPDLFHNDLQTEFIISSGFDPLGYRALYWLGTRFMDPLSFSQILTLLLLLTSLCLLYGLASEIIPDPKGRIICGVLFLFYSLYHGSGGFPRSFAYPLLLAFLFFLQKGSSRWAVATIAPAALFYPPVFISILALALWEFCFRRIRQVERRRLVRDFLTLMLVVSLSSAFLISQYGSTDGKAWGEHVTPEQARDMPEFHQDGRTSFFLDNPLSYLLQGRSGIGQTHIVGFAIVFALMAMVGGIQRMRIPSISFDLIWTSLIVFTAAHLVLFRLHLPSRYTLYTIPLAFMLAIGASVVGVFQRFQRISYPVPVKNRTFQTSKILGWVVLALLVFGYGYVQGHYICRLDPQFVTLDRQDREMLDFLATLPKDGLVAGHPMDMDNVPLVARRRVVANHELSIPYYLGYYRRVRTRLMDMLKAYYAKHWQVVETFVDYYGVDALVVRNEHFRKDILAGSLYFEPFNSVIKEGWKSEDQFVLVNPPQQLRCFENNRYLVLCWEK
jgi:hypothetical protein